MVLEVKPDKAAAAVDGAWQALVRDSAGNAAKSLLSAPLGYGVSALFKMLVPDAQTTALQEVGDIVRRIEGEVARGMAQIDAHLARMELGIDQGFRQLTEEVFASRLSEPLTRIDYFAGRVRDEAGFRIDAKDVFELDVRVEAICAALLHAPLSGQRHGFLAAAASALHGAFPAGSFASVHLVRAAEAFSARFSSGLLAALRGLTLVEAGLTVNQGAQAAKARRERFLAQQLPGLLDAYRHGVESLALAALAKAPTDADAKDAARWRDLVDCAFHVLRQADLTVMGAACHLSGVAVPAVWMSGRVIGTARAVAWGRERVEGLQALCQPASSQTGAAAAAAQSTTPAQVKLAGLGAVTVVRHPELTLVALAARGQAPGGPPLLVEREASDVHLLRYVLTGFDAGFVKGLDDLAALAAGQPMVPLALRGRPALGRIASHALAFDPVFQPIAVDFAGVDPAPASRHLAELALALPLPPLQATRTARPAPWRLDAGLDAVCSHQLADAAQHAWNRAHPPQPDAPTAPAATAGKAPNVATAQALLTLPEQAADVTALALSPDGQTLACGLSDGQVALWALPDGALQHTLAAHTRAVRALLFSSDGLSLVSGSDDKTLGVWIVASGQLARRLTHHHQPVLTLTGVPASTEVISAGRDGVYRFDPANGTVVRKLIRQGPAAALVAPTADPAVLASGDQGGVVQLIDRDSLQDLPGMAFNDPALYEADPQGTQAVQAVTQVRCTPGGQRMVVLGGPARRAQLWDLRTRRLMHLLGGADFRPQLALLQDEGHQVLLATADGRLQLCDLATGSVLREGRGAGALGALAAGTGTGSGSWWLACGRQVTCWPELQLPGAATPAVVGDAAQRLQADLGAWLEAAQPAPADLLDARGVVVFRSRFPDAVRDTRQRRHGSQWLALSTAAGHTLAWRDDPADARAWPVQAADRSVHADGPALPWVDGETLPASFSKLRDPVSAHGFLRMEHAGIDGLTLQTGAGLYIMVDAKGVVSLSDTAGRDALLQPVLLPAGQIALRDQRGRYLSVETPGGHPAPHEARTIVLDTLRLQTLAPAQAERAQDGAPLEACRFTLHFAEPGVSPQPAWMDGSVLDAWHRHTVCFTDLAMSGFGGYGESRAWHCELLRRQAAGRAGLTTADSAGAARLKVEVWGVRQLISGDLDRAMTRAAGTVKHRVQLHLGVSGQPGQRPQDEAFHAIRDLPFEVHERWRPAPGSQKEPAVINGPADAEFYASGEVELAFTGAAWLRVTSEMRQDWWTRQPNSWATLGVRIRDLRLSWA